MSLRKSLLAGAIALIASSAAWAAQPYAQPLEQPTTSAPVSLSDLNLRTNRGANAAVDRIVDVSDRACGLRPHVDPVYNDSLREFRICRDRTIRQAVADTHSRLVARVYAERYGTITVE